MTEEEIKAEKVIDEFGEMLIDTFGKAAIKQTEYSATTRQITVYCKDGTVYRIAIQQIN